MPFNINLLRRRKSHKPRSIPQVYESPFAPPPYSPESSSTQANLGQFPPDAVYEGELKTWPSAEKKEHIITSEEEERLNILSAYDTVFVVDDSTSMRIDRRWEQAQEAIATLTKYAVKEDKDGIDIHFLNRLKPGLNIKTEDGARRLFDFKPSGPTPLGMKLGQLLRGYERKFAAATEEDDCKPVNFLVITDGEPTDTVVDVIVNAARRCDNSGMPLHQVGIQFVQIGGSPAVVKFLKSLDDDIARISGVRDMVDTTQFNPDAGGNLTPEDLIKTLLGGINRREDNKNPKNPKMAM